MEVSVGQAADALGVTPSRVRQLIAAHRVRARKVGREWLVDGASLPDAPRLGRPMSRAVAWAFLNGRQPDNPQEAWRYRQRLRRLTVAPEPERLLASWVASRGDRLLFVANEPAAVLADPRVVRSGVSDPRAGLSAAEWAEGWVRADDLKALRRTHLLRRAEGAYRVVLHVADELPPSPVPLLLLAADLVDHQGARELARARELIRGSLA